MNHREQRLRKAIQFHDKLARSWNEGYERGGFKKRLAFVRRIISDAVIAGENWLDAGCGAGILALELAACGAHGIAIDGNGGSNPNARHRVIGNYVLDACDAGIEVADGVEWCDFLGAFDDGGSQPPNVVHGHV